MSIPQDENPLGVVVNSTEGYFTIIDGTGTNEYGFSGNVDSLTNGSSMFKGYSRLTSWSLNLPNLENGS